MVIQSNHSWPPPVPERDPRHALLVRAAEALHADGTAAYRLEEAVARLSKALGVRARVFATPTSVQLALESPAGTTTELLRARGEDANLGRLAELDRILSAAERHELSPGEARWAIARLRNTRTIPGLTSALASAVVSATAAVFFGGSAVDVAISAAFGAALMLLARLTARVTEASRVHEPLAAFLTSLAAWCIAMRLPGVTPEVVTLSTLITLVPGLTVTTAVSELASGHFVSGTSRLAGAATLFMSLAFGVALGHAVAGLLGASSPLARGGALPSAAQTVALLLAPLAFAVLFRAARRDVPAIWVGGVLAFASARFAAAAIGPELGGFFGALVLGVVSNGYARWLDRPASILRLPGLLLLVPGSVGFRSLASFMAEDPLAGMSGIFGVALIAMGLVAGLFTANVLLRPRRSL